MSTPKDSLFRDRIWRKNHIIMVKNPLRQNQASAFDWSRQRFMWPILAVVLLMYNITLADVHWKFICPKVWNVFYLDLEQQRKIILVDNNINSLIVCNQSSIDTYFHFSKIRLLWSFFLNFQITSSNVVINARNKIIGRIIKLREIVVGVVEAGFCSLMAREIVVGVVEAVFWSLMARK